MAHSEACQLFIEQQIKEGLAAGKNPYSIGKELTVMIEKYFEASIPSETIRSRARHIQKKAGEITTPHITPSNRTKNLDKRVNQVVIDAKGKFTEGTAPGPGRPLKYEKPIEPYSCALQMATIAISQLSRIMKDDPKREEAFQAVIKWINDNK